VASTTILKLSLTTVLLSMTYFTAAADSMVITGTPATRVTVGETYSFKPLVKNGITPLLRFSYINKPTWSKGYRGSGLIMGAPTQAGVWENIQIVASDGIHYAWSKPFTITVVSASAATRVAISGTPKTTAEVGQPYSFVPTVVATTDSKWTYTVKNKPAWAAFNGLTGALSGKPASATPASFDGIVISVSNGTSTAALPAFNIDVTEATAGTATLTWLKPAPNTGESAIAGLKGYLIRYGTSLAALNKEFVVPSAGSTGAEIRNLSSGMWYFEVAAVTSANVVGEYSAIASDKIL
jgi:hypothetical protein